MTETTMKTWQRGYPLSDLLAIETHYAAYNDRARSPFSRMKKNTIADKLHHQELQRGEGWSYVRTTAKVRTPMAMFADVPFGTRQMGDTTLTHLAVDWANHAWQQEWDRLVAEPAPMWIQVWADDAIAVEQVSRVAQRVGTKVTSFGEVFAWFVRCSASELPYRSIAYEQVNTHVMSTLALPATFTAQVTAVAEAYAAQSFTWANHYSKYNIGHTWSALALRGYSADPSMIEKPDAMDDAWQAAHRHETLALQNTVIRQQLPEIEPVLAALGEIEWDRIRLMRLAPQCGELQRHTDQVDRTLGVGVGKLMRIHVPLKTNPQVLFTVWNAEGRPCVAHMPFGVASVLDARWPHRAVNGGAEERIHLVMDGRTTPALQNLLAPYSFV